MSIGQTIRSLREQQGYDQAELARLVDIAPSTLWRIEREDRTPRGATLRRLADVLGVDVPRLRGGDRAS